MGWSAMSFPGSSTLTSAQMTQIASNFYAAFNQESGGPTPSGIWSWASTSILDAAGSHHFGTLKIDSAVYIQGAQLMAFGSGANSGGSVTANSFFNAPLTKPAYQAGGNSVLKLLQRVHVFDTTSRSIASATYSSYTIASMTPVSSLSSITVRAIFWWNIQADASGTVGGSNLCRNPTTSTSLFLMTNCGDGVGQQTMGRIFSGINAGGGTMGGVMTFERVDSATDLSPKIYGIQIQRASGAQAVVVPAHEFILEEWL